MGRLLFVCIITVSVCQTTVAQNKTDTCRNIYQVSHLHQTLPCCNNGSGIGKATEDLKIQMAALQARVQTLEKKDNITTSPCPKDYLGRLNGSCYKFVTTPTEWMKAYLKCREEGADLVMIETREENAYLHNYIKGAAMLRMEYYYTAGTDLVHEGVWTWASTGNPLLYTAWDKNEPNGFTGENCLHIYKSKDTWNDTACDSKRGYICEKSKAKI